MYRRRGASEKPPPPPPIRSEQQIGDTCAFAPGHRLLIGGRLQILQTLGDGGAAAASRAGRRLTVQQHCSRRRRRRRWAVGRRSRDAQLEVRIDGHLLRRVAT